MTEVDPAITEEWKRNTPVWSHGGLVCSAAAFKNHVKLNFFQGSKLADPSGLLNAGFEAKVMRAVDVYQGDLVDDAGLRARIIEAVTLNTSDVHQGAWKP